MSEDQERPPATVYDILAEMEVTIETLEELSTDSGQEQLDDYLDGILSGTQRWHSRLKAYAIEKGREVRDRYTEAREVRDEARAALTE